MSANEIRKRLREATERLSRRVAQLRRDSAEKAAMGRLHARGPRIIAALTTTEQGSTEPTNGDEG